MSKTTAPHPLAECPKHNCFSAGENRTRLPANDIAQQRAHMRKLHPSMKISRTWHLVLKSPHGVIQPPPSRTGKHSLKLLAKNELRSRKAEPEIEHPETPIKSFKELPAEEEDQSVMIPDLAV